jgi:GDP-L-fucose synthase
MADDIFSLRGKRVFVAGHRGMAGSAIVRRLRSEDCEIVTADRGEVDLRDRNAVAAFMDRTRPQVVFLAAAKVGGIAANARYPVDFLADNLAIQQAVFAEAFRVGVEKLLFLGSSCIYPKHAPQPMTEDQLLTGPLEPTNQWYAIAKIAGIKMCDAYREQYGADFVSVMPTNLFGPGDNYHPEHSHVPAALIRRFHEAKVAGHDEVVVWGTGQPRREFMYVDDFADGCVFVMKRFSGAGFLNIGTGQDVSIAEFASLVRDVVGVNARIGFDTSRPDGTPRKLLDVSRMADLGWRASTPLREGLEVSYRWYLDHLSALRTE